MSDTPPYGVQIVTTCEDLEALASQWTAFLQKTGEVGIYYDHEWLVEWLRHFPVQRVLVILLYDPTQGLVAAAPFQITRPTRGLFRRGLRHVQFIGTEPTVYAQMKVLTLPSVDRPEILRKIAHVLQEHRHLWDVIDLQCSPMTADLETLQSVLTPVTARSHLAQSTLIYEMDLRGLVAGNIEGFPKNYLKNVRNTSNRLKRDFPEESIALSFVTYASESQDPSYRGYFEAFARYHEDYWHQKGTRSDFARFPKLASFYHRMFCHYNDETYFAGSFHLNFLKVGPHVLCHHLDFWQSNTLSGYMLAYNPDFVKYSPSLLHYDMLLNALVERGAEAMDLGRGASEYKQHWILPDRTREIRLYDLTMWKSPWVQWLWQADSLLKRLLKKA